MGAVHLPSVPNLEDTWSVLLCRSEVAACFFLRAVVLICVIPRLCCSSVSKDDEASSLGSVGRARVLGPV